MKEADEIYVLDTGSTDNTVKYLKSLGVNVYTKEIKPWRFDIARNESLAIVPLDTDICVCTDLDEVFEKSWREKLEKSWKKNTTKLKYTYNWSLNKNNKPLVSFYYDKIHTRIGYKWIYPVHEVLKYEDSLEHIEYNDKIILNHYPDTTKLRSSYLPLLELFVKENPDNDRNMHYLGREYMYYKKWDKCIETLKKYLTLPNATWKDERSASMRYIARSYKYLKNYNESKKWLDKAINETPCSRDPYVERALVEYELNNYYEVEKYCLFALKIKYHKKTYINEIFSWDSTIYDLLSVACYNLQKYNDSLKWINLATKMNPTDKRLINNKKTIKNKVS